MVVEGAVGGKDGCVVGWRGRGEDCRERHITEVRAWGGSCGGDLDIFMQAMLKL